MSASSVFPVQLTITELSVGLSLALAPSPGVCQEATTATLACTDLGPWWKGISYHSLCLRHYQCSSAAGRAGLGRWSGNSRGELRGRQPRILPCFAGRPRRPRNEGWGKPVPFVETLNSSRLRWLCNWSPAESVVSPRLTVISAKWASSTALPGRAVRGSVRRKRGGSGLPRGQGHKQGLLHLFCSSFGRAVREGGGRSGCFESPLSGRLYIPIRPNGHGHKSFRE